MKKKDFELIASVLKYRIITLDDNTIAKVLVKDFANNLSDLYPRFDKQKFLRACGVEIDINDCKIHGHEYMERHKLDGHYICRACVVESIK